MCIRDRYQRRVRGTLENEMAEVVKSLKVFGGSLIKFKHASTVCKSPMVYSVFSPPSATPEKPVPLIMWLSGLTCTDDNFMQKAGAFKAACEAGVAICCPDTSPRQENLIEDEGEGWDFGTGAGFYVNATQQRWSDQGYHMYDYVTEELPGLVAADASIDTTNVSVMGHSMGGHGALVCALKNPGKYKSCSAFAPICNPTGCPWGEKAFTGYLGSVDAGKEYDASILAQSYEGPKLDILADQGGADSFLTGDVDQLRPQTLVEGAAGNANLSVTSRVQEGYDHSYFFIASFIEEHIQFHASHLK
eukprot:TRINITY_DN9291_c0_g1_i1.p1 TRINITY_DN9291_c0_g1~~TRINITY_DN9291_c0_g1_i1.p1  ORF type:complete len:304 (+),score=94.77 TRINITY_DN9291_c0_g1_i1:144-1055(+)